MSKPKKRPGKTPITERMRKQKPCGDHCKGSRHLHIEHKYDDGDICFVGYGQYGDQFMTIHVGSRFLCIDAPELREIARGVVMKPRTKLEKLYAKDGK